MPFVIRRWLARGAVIVAAGALTPVAPASAHPLDQVLHQVKLTPDAGVLGVEVDLLPGALVAGAFAATVDTDGNQALSDAEIADHAARVASALTLTADGVALPVTVGRTSYPEYRMMAAGGGITAILASIPVPPGTSKITFHDAYGGGQPTAVQMSVTVAEDATVGAIRQVDADNGRTVSFETTPRTPGTSPARQPIGLKDRALLALSEPLASPWTLIVLIGVCAVLGAFHALTPGHGKTLMAAYLVGAKGTVREALALGGIITVTHTASVLLVGTLVLLLGDSFLPGILVPALELLTGAVVLFLGVRLARRRWTSLRPSAVHSASAHPVPVHVGGHDHEHAHSHAPAGTQDHVHDGAHDHGHSHHVPRSWRELVAMGLTGGLIPCPEALSILILAVGLHRTGLGLAMIVAFSIGLAAVLVGLGLILVTARGAIQRVRPAGDSVLLTRLPLASAAVVVILGVAMTVTGLLSVANAV